MQYIITSLCLGFLLIASGCSTDSEDCPPGAVEYPNQQELIDGRAYKQSSVDCRTPKVQTFRFNNFTGAEIKAAQNTVILIRQEAFTRLDGTTIDGEITLSILEMYRPGEIIACQLSTNGINDANSVEPLLSESIFYLNAEYNDEPVLLKGEIQIFIPSENKGLQLSVFNSPDCTELDCQVLWEIIPQSTVFEEPYQGAIGDVILGYRSFITELGWYSFARYNPNRKEPGILYNKALPQYSLSNSNVFLMYDSNSVAIGMFSEFDTANEVFSEKYSEIPKNTPANVIFVSKPKNEFSFDSSPIITEDGKITVTRNPQNGSESNLIDYINNL